jgi:hypothetical protein
MTQDVFTWFSRTSTFSTLVPLIVLLIYWKNQPRQNLILAISLCISVVFDLIGSAVAATHTSNILYLNLYFIVAFPAIMLFYHETLIKKSLKILVRIFTIVFLTCAIVFAFQQGLKIVNNNTWTLSSALITITSFLFVGDLNFMDDSNFTKNPFHQTNIILNTSLALYYFVTIVIFAATGYIFSNLSKEDIFYFWSFHNVAHVLKNIGVAVAFYLSAKRNVALMER